jgi:hypothetical protein
MELVSGFSSVVGFGIDARVVKRRGSARIFKTAFENNFV